MHIKLTYGDWFDRVEIDGVVLTPAASLKVANHSPDGFAWGYHGSGPSQLALAILLAAGVSEADAVWYHHRFKAEFLGNLPRADAEFDVDVTSWVRNQTKYQLV